MNLSIITLRKSNSVLNSEVSSTLTSSSIGKKGEAKIYTRTAVVLSKQLNELYPIKAQYMNELDGIVTREGEGSVLDYYEVIGYPGDIVTPRIIGNLWGNDPVAYEGLDSMLVQAYRHGLEV